jgi:hypothetical protein
MEYNSGSSYSQNPNLRIPLVKGSPYISAEVPLPAVPIIRGPGNGGGVISSVTQVTPTKLKVLVGGVPGGEGSHTFLVWGSKPFSYTLSGGSIRIQETAATAGGKFSGRIRLAWAPNAGQPGAAAIEAMLDQYVDAIPTGGSVKAWSNLAAGTTSYSLSWSTQSLSGAASPLTKPLMLALPHHIDTLAAPATGSAAAAASEGGADLAADQATAAVVGAVSFPLGVAPAGSGSSAGLGSNGVYTSQPPQGSGRSPLDFGVYIMTVRGPQVPVAGSCWVLQEQVVPLTTETQAAANLRNPAWRSEIEQTLLVCFCDWLGFTDQMLQLVSLHGLHAAFCPGHTLHMWRACACVPAGGHSSCAAPGLRQRLCKLARRLALVSPWKRQGTAVLQACKSTMCSTHVLYRTALVWHIL